MRYYLYHYNSPDSGMAGLLGCEYCNSPAHKFSAIDWIRGAWRMVRKSRKGDTIVCQYDFQAVMCNVFSRFMGGREIYCINLLLKDKNTLKNKITAGIYKLALKSDNFHATVTSAEYGKFLQKQLKVKKDFFLLHDLYQKRYEGRRHYDVMPSSVFCGGYNARNWPLMFKIAKMVPEVTFNIILPQHEYKKYIEQIPGNVHVQTEVPFYQFMRTICRSEFVCLPLDTDAPAGLLVMFQAAANGKLVFMSSTATSREYITDERGVLLPDDPEEWCKALRYYMQHKDEANKKALELKKFVRKECSRELYVKRLQEWTKADTAN
ncbi:MAG: glycosyltransferase [Prevotella sp.]|nr:glycosyltransferase [Prevotella sp.]